KGPNVMMGYYKNPEQSSEVLRDGWFYTGDIGVIEHGFLKITDRKKELFKTSGGKYVAPQVIENALKELLWIEQAMVIGDGQKFPSALIVPAMDALRAWASEQKLEGLTNEELLTHPAVMQQFKKNIDSINTRFGSWEQVKSFRLLPRLFDIEHGEITPTLKLKRKQILQNWSAQVEDIYKNQHSE
ncbi:MAG: long-chain fatty acid--CoA ligase, partial [Flavobacteriales bacterium]